jgi:TatD DNase family protein
MLVDSHCHLHSIDLTEFNQDLASVIAQAQAHDVTRFLSVCVELSDYKTLEAIAARFSNVNISVGIHPNHTMDTPITAQMLCDLAANPACIAIGETGLDYYRTLTDEAQEMQRSQFREHIKASRMTSKRQAAQDTLLLMKEENADQIGGVMHCFSEDLSVARQAIDLNFYISFSGILTFKNATTLQEVARSIPLDRILIETDSPYLAPVPFRGKQNHPALVQYVAKALAQLRGIRYEEVAEATTQNFKECFFRTDTI